jgi:predicted phosphodiesterase
MAKFQIVSDTHLEFRGNNFKNLIKPSAPILLLLGDICVCGSDEDWEIYKNFITFLALQFQYIFHIPGNHEYYTSNRNITINNTIPQINNKIRKFTKTFNNVFFLNNDTTRLKINKKVYVFIGTTLWSGVAPDNRKFVQSYMNDYNNIHYPNKSKSSEKLTRKFNITDMSELHVKAVKYIRKALKNTKPNENVILLTHHKPYRTKPITDVLSQAYETDLFPTIIQPQSNFKLIAYGHTHVAVNHTIAGVKIVSNPKGYPSERTGYLPKFTVII